MDNNGYTQGVCEVHKYALNDSRTRNVFFCSICDAMICDECNNNIPRRAKAMMIRAKRRLFDRDFK